MGSKHRNNVITRPATVTLSVLDGNGIYPEGSVWGTVTFELAWKDWLLTEPECDGLRFLYAPKDKPRIEFLVYNGKLWDTTYGDPQEVVVDRLYKIK